MSVAKFYPYNGERGRLRLGLKKISFSEWIQYENKFSERISHKQELTRALGRKVLDALPESLATQNEFLSLLIDNIQRHHGETFDVHGKIISVKSGNKTYNIDAFKNCPLELASYLATDDFCLLEEDGEDYKLVAASVCAPTWWSLQEKLGKPLASIHGPIKNLEEKIGRMIRHFLKSLDVADCYQRSNWFLFASNDLCVFPNSFDFNSEMTAINEHNIGTNLFLRSERQTFRKLQRTNAIVFGINVYVEPLSIVKAHPAIAKDLHVSLDTMDEEQKRSLGINYVEKALRNYLDKVISI